MASLVRLKGDTLARFEKINPVLRIKEPALIALDPANPTKYTHMVIGDGKTKFKDLPKLNLGGSSSYEDLENLPSIENVRLIGDVTLDQIGAVRQEDFDKRMPIVIDVLASDYQQKVLTALDSMNRDTPVPTFLKVDGLTLYVCGWRTVDSDTMLWVTAPLAVKGDVLVELGVTSYSVNTTDGSITAQDQMLTKVLSESALVQEIGSGTDKVMSQDAVTKVLKTQIDACFASAKKYTDDNIIGHNTSETAHIDIRNLLNSCVGLPTYDDTEYSLTFTTIDGRRLVIDLPIEQLALRYNVETQSIEFTNADGSVTSIPVAAFVKIYTGSIGSQIQVNIGNDNDIHASILKNSIDWDSLSFALQERINSHISAEEFATQAVRTDIEQTLSIEAQNQALENIGADLVRIPYSLLGTTLSDEMFAVVDNAKGIILVDTPSDYRNPTVFVKGNNTSSSCMFVSFVAGTTYSIITFNKSTKLLSGISSGLTYEGSVRYAEYQSLTTAQQERALNNIGFPLVHLDFALIGTTLSDNIYNAVASAKGIILENVPDSNNAPSLYLVGNSDTVTTIFVSEFNARIWFVLTLSHSSKKLSLVSTGYASDVVRYGEGQKLTDAQKQQARSNIGVQSADELLEDADFIASLKVKLGIE